ncbi:MAG TPA: hypothetical protein VJT67_03335 [Longimicrobiaceae bacterium]|nr:hypothetical protein [Longimicrobiaceae bacterium]
MTEQNVFKIEELEERFEMAGDTYDDGSGGGEEFASICSIC